MSFSDRWAWQKRRRRLGFILLFCACVAGAYLGERELERRGVLRWKEWIEAATRPAPAPPPVGEVRMPSGPARRGPAPRGDSAGLVRGPERDEEPEAPKPAPPKRKLALGGGFRPFQKPAPPPPPPPRYNADFVPEQDAEPLRQKAPVMGSGPSDTDVRDFQRAHQDPVALQRLRERIDERHGREESRRRLARLALVGAAIVVAAAVLTVLISGFWRVLFGVQPPGPR
jgi:hypothetical protein